MDRVELGQFVKNWEWVGLGQNISNKDGSVCIRKQSWHAKLLKFDFCDAKNVKTLKAHFSISASYRPSPIFIHVASMYCYEIINN